MGLDHDELYMVYLRAPRNDLNAPESAERPLVTCYTYGEARRIQRLFQRTTHECVIRYLGQAGGGD
jgi:hypothetical protein